MPKQNYRHQKKQKEDVRKARQAEKQRRRQERVNAQSEPPVERGGSVVPTVNGSDG